MQLIKIITNTFKGGELSNDAYHTHSGISGTGLSTIYSKSVKNFLEDKRKPSDALGFGIASHAGFLEPQLFDREFYCGFDESKYPNAMRTTNDLKEYCSLNGLKVSGSKGDLIKRCSEHAKEVNQDIQILDVLKSEWDARNKGLIEVSKKDFDQLMRMRERLYSDNEIAALLLGGYVEKSIICEVDFYDEFNQGETNKGQYTVCVKIRPDLVSRNGFLVDYKTCTDCDDRFGDEIFKFNYDMKMALQRDVLKLVTGYDFRVVLLAQEKLTGSYESIAHDFVPWFLEEDTLANGKAKYLMAIKKWIHYKNTKEVVGRSTAPRIASMKPYHKVF